ncbi:MAG: hypothetical protein QM571_02845 [Micrococcaceae bacterium]
MDLDTFITTFEDDPTAVNTFGASKQLSLFYLFDTLVVRGGKIEMLLSETPKDILLEGLGDDYTEVTSCSDYQYGDVVIWEDTPVIDGLVYQEGLLGIATVDIGLSLVIFCISGGGQGLLMLLKKELRQFIVLRKLKMTS